MIGVVVRLVALWSVMRLSLGIQLTRLLLLLLLQLKLGLLILFAHLTLQRFEIDGGARNPNINRCVGLLDDSEVVIKDSLFLV